MGQFRSIALWHGFSRAIKIVKMAAALAAEVRLGKLIHYQTNQ
jgi:hypothetical protein